MLSDEKIDAKIAARVAEFEGFARGDGLYAIQARDRLRRLRELTPEQQRAAYREADAAGKTESAIDWSETA